MPPPLPTTAYTCILLSNQPAFGVANGFGRIGGMVSPFIGQDLIEQGKHHLAQVIFGTLCLTAAVAALMLNTETSHAKMDGPHESENTMSGLHQHQHVELTEAGVSGMNESGAR
jgi:small-conductance mechanosensitive channel